MESFITNLPEDIFDRLPVKSFVALDFETTGLDHITDRIIEIGAVRFTNGQEADKYSSFVYPGVALSPFISQLTGITDEDLKNAPYPVEILPGLKEFIGTDPIVAQNAPFDINFLKTELSRLGEPFYPKNTASEIAFDTAVLARTLLPEIESHSLRRLAEFFRIRCGVQHRAEDDARRCGFVFLGLLGIMLNLALKETADAARILEKGVTARLFTSLTKYLSENGAAAEPENIKPYSKNLLGSISENDLPHSPQQMIAGIMEEKGTLSRFLNKYEFRPRQLEMSQSCLTALQQDSYLMAEAGTGTGKSFAYIIPAILYAVAEKQRVIVSTNTKNLQDQLFNKDLPFLEKSLPLKFQAAMLKGRSNYLCRKKWFEVLTDPDSHLSRDEREKALALVFWANRTATGDISENNGFRSGRSGGVWSKVASEAGSCSGQRCSQYRKCFLQKARAQAVNSHIVVVNHALILSDIASDNAILGEYNNLIVDEAHNLEKAASNYLGLEISIWRIRTLCQRLYSKDGGETGILKRLRNIKAGDGKRLADLIRKAVSDTNKLKAAAGDYFNALNESAKESADYRQNNYALKKRYGPNDAVISAGADFLSELTDSVKKTRGNLSALIQFILDNEIVEAEGIDFDLELNALADEAARLHDDLINLTTADDADWVYWWELPKRDDAYVSLYSAPISPGDILNEKLYPLLDTAILTSATLTVENKFDYYRERLGFFKIEKNVEYLNFGSPFDFEKQAVFGTPVFMPSPKNTDSFLETLSEIIIDLASVYKLGTLILFTSYSQLLKVYELISNTLKQQDIQVLAQGVEGSRTDLLRRFLKKKSVLLGTDSFWEGIDAPGEALEVLIIAKIPFDVPTEPLIQARTEKLEREGRNPFMEYTVPEAAIKLRQGIGRLIRSSTDKGAVILCDSRITNTKWGSVFVSSLPGRLHHFRNKNEIRSYLSEMFKNG